MAKRHSQFQLAADLGAAMIDTSITLWWRWPILMAAGLPTRNSAELSRMVAEKTAAMTAGAIAAQTEAMKIAAAAMTGKRTENVPAAIAGAAIKPALRTVKANAKRLRRRKR
jgi:hypothetical protein